MDDPTKVFVDSAENTLDSPKAQRYKDDNHHDQRRHVADRCLSCYPKVWLRPEEIKERLSNRKPGQREYVSSTPET